MKKMNDRHIFIITMKTMKISFEVMPFITVTGGVPYRCSKAINRSKNRQKNEIRSKEFRSKTLLMREAKSICQNKQKNKRNKKTKPAFRARIS